MGGIDLLALLDQTLGFPNRIVRRHFFLTVRRPPAFREREALESNPAQELDVKKHFRKSRSSDSCGSG